MLKCLFYTLFLSMYFASFSQNTGSSNLQTFNSGALEMVFPQNQTYEYYELTHFKWESVLDSTYQYYLILSNDSDLSNPVLDTLITLPYFEYAGENYQYESDTFYLAPCEGTFPAIPVENRLDLQSLLSPGQSYFWQLIASNQTHSNSINGSFELLEASRLITNTFSQIDSISKSPAFFRYFAIPVDSYGNLEDVNVSVQLGHEIDYFSVPLGIYPPSFNLYLVCPAGQEVQLMSYDHGMLPMRQGRIFDDEAFLPEAQLYEHLIQNRPIECVDWHNSYERLELNAEHVNSKVIIQPTESLDTLKGTDIHGTWLLKLQMWSNYGGQFHLDPSSIRLEFSVEQHPIQLAISEWDSLGVSLDWNTSTPFNQFRIEKKGVGDNDPYVPIAQTERQSFFDAFPRPDTAFYYRIVAEQGDQRHLSNAVLVRTALSPPKYGRVIIDVSAGSHPDSEPFVALSLDWKKAIAEQGYINEQNETLYQQLRYEIGPIRAFHEFDTSGWSEPPYLAIDDMAASPNIIRRLSSDSITFRWYSEYEYFFVRLFVDRIEPNGDLTPIIDEGLFENRISDNPKTGQFTLTAEKYPEILANLTPGEYRWYIRLSGSSSNLFIQSNPFTVHIDEILSVNHPGESYEIFPNPSSEVVHLSGLIPESVIRILSISGQLIKTYHPILPQMQLDISDLSKGIYLVENRSKEKILTKRLIVK